MGFNSGFKGLKVHLKTFLSIKITQKCQILSCDILVANERYVNCLRRRVADTDVCVSCGNDVGRMSCSLLRGSSSRYTSNNSRDKGLGIIASRTAKPHFFQEVCVCYLDSDTSLFVRV